MNDLQNLLYSHAADIDRDFGFKVFIHHVPKSFLSPEHFYVQYANGTKRGPFDFSAATDLLNDLWRAMDHATRSKENAMPETTNAYCVTNEDGEKRRVTADGWHVADGLIVFTEGNEAVAGFNHRSIRSVTKVEPRQGTTTVVTLTPTPERIRELLDEELPDRS